VDLLIRQLGLSVCQHTMIGGPTIRGLSGGERKRTSIGVELLTNPSLIFLDEPTTGLDSATANNVILLLQEIAKSGRTVVSTIHQPSSQVFKKFDRLMLLCEGQIIYQGSSEESVGYFSKFGQVCPKNENPSNYFMKIMNPEGLIIEKLQAQKEAIKINLDEDILKDFKMRIDNYVITYK